MMWFWSSSLAHLACLTARKSFGYFGLVRLCTEFVKIGPIFILSIDPVAICVDNLARICFLWPEFVFCGHILDELAR